jgi:response regulator RpfG family c-di-GMP phosphodiesterase
LENNKILFIAEDNEISRFLIEQLMVEAGYFVAFKNNPKDGLLTFKDGGFDLVITNPKMQDSSSIELIKEVRRSDPDTVIVALLDDHKQELMEYLLDLGVYDFITKPINLEKLLFLVRKGIDMHTIMATNRRLTQGLRENNFALEKQNILLAKRVEDSTKNLTRLYEDLRATYMRTIKVLAQAIDARDHYTHSHSETVAKYAMVLATEMGLSAKEVETIRQACELHDLGKIGIGDSILSKMGRLPKKNGSRYASIL